MGRRKGDKDKKEDVPSLEKVNYFFPHIIGIGNSKSLILKSKKKKQIIEILQTILDASFLTLLQHQPCHKILRSLSAHLKPEIAFANAIEGSRGFLEPFAPAQEKTAKESLVTPQGTKR